MSRHTIWTAIAEPTRRRLIELLRNGPRTTGELCAAFPTTRFGVMKHLRILQQVGLVEVHREGRYRWNRLNAEPLLEVERRWPGAASDRSAPVPASQGNPGGELPAAADVRQVFLDAVPWRVFDALTVNLSAWWGGRHLRSAEASGVVLEPQPGGRFFEEWGHRQGALRGVVSAIKRDERLEITGPIFDESRASRLVFVLEPREGGTLLTSRAESAPAGVLDDLVCARLKPFVERGGKSGVSG
jgi:DNA-binding transcriptional ArsR family regulator